jgi:protein-S-isoprenylcysteine O-methyltransferase Ste14
MVSGLGRPVSDTLFENGSGLKDRQPENYMTQSAQHNVDLKNAYRASVIYNTLYLVAAVFCLINWRGVSGVRSGVNLFTIVFLVLIGLWLLHRCDFDQTVLLSDDLRKEFSGIEYDPDTRSRVGALLAYWPLIDLVIILEYGQWRPVPLLEQRILQAAGIVLFAAALGWVIWVDSYLVKYFLLDKKDREILVDGPYRYVRHPRYCATIAYRIAYALVFASLLGWAMAVIWVALVSRRIRSEEAHMRELFGSRYETYAQRTARLLPGVY